MEDLIKLRESIDQIDKEIVRLYTQRMGISEKVAEYKIATGKKVFDKERENSKLDNLSKLAVDDFMEHGIRELFEQIVSTSRKKQYQLMTEHGIVEKENFTEVEKLDFSNAKIVFQGVEGAYSQLAMKTYFGENCNGYNVDTWKDAMEEIKCGNADYAVLPIENSSAGIVSENYDLLVEYDNYIVDEQIIRIDHSLMGIPGAKLSDIKTVYSHPQALMQCSDFLDEHREWNRISLKNTAFSAKKVKDDGDISQAAIASHISADIYGLEVLENRIQNNKNNATRFIIVTSKKICRRNSDRISICFETPHKSGALYHMLAHFIYNGVNMLNIQSRPIPGKAWEYRFFVDFEGRFSDTAVQNALRGLKEETASLKVLGTY
ncbi:bifunctional chorismate mutase/prephenate dehydratase [Agathobacter sp.]